MDMDSEQTHLPPMLQPSFLDVLLRTWQRNGFVVLPNVLDAVETEVILQEIRDLYKHHINRECPLFLYSNAVQRNSRFLALIDLPVILKMVVNILGPFIHLLSSEVWVRPIGAQSLGWHRDGGPLMRHVQGTIQVKVQFFLTDCSEQASGNLILLSGSHRRRLPEQTISISSTDPKIVVLTPKAGDAVIWSGSTWHSVQSNLSSNDRVSIILAYGLLWLRPYDYDHVDEQVVSVATPLQALLLSGLVNDFERGMYYYPVDVKQRLTLFEEHLGPLGSLPFSDLNSYADRKTSVEEAKDETY